MMVTSGGDKVQLQSKDSGAIDESATFDQNDGWILLEFKLIDWSYMDFSRVFRSSTTIHTIKEVIENYHGGNIQKLTLCKDTYSETNELRNDRITIQECLGISGSLDKNKAPVIRICYDFLPDGCTEPDPILMF